MFYRGRAKKMLKSRAKKETIEMGRRAQKLFKNYPLDYLALFSSRRPKSLWNFHGLGKCKVIGVLQTPFQEFIYCEVNELKIHS